MPLTKLRFLPPGACFPVLREYLQQPALTLTRERCCCAGDPQLLLALLRGPIDPNEVLNQPLLHRACTAAHFFGTFQNLADTEAFGVANGSKPLHAAVALARAGMLGGRKVCLP
jgi:hypothetical protein